MATFSSFADCSNNSSRSYDSDVCTTFQDGCPSFVNTTNSSKPDPANIYPDVYEPDVLDQASKEADAKCVHFGQCTVLNPQGNSYQSWPDEQAMRYTFSYDKPGTRPPRLKIRNWRTNPNPKFLIEITCMWSSVTNLKNCPSH